MTEMQATLLVTADSIDQSSVRNGSATMHLSGEVTGASLTLPGEDGPEYVCPVCGDAAAEYPNGWRHDSNDLPLCPAGPSTETDCPRCDGFGRIPIDATHDDCAVCGGSGTIDGPPVDPTPTPYGFANSAGIRLITYDGGDQAVECAISVGDPRGAFKFVVRRALDGTLYLHLPYDGEPQPHAHLVPIHPGTYRIE